MDGPKQGVFTARLQLAAAERVEIALMAYTYSDIDDKKIGSANRRTPWKGSKHKEFGAAGFKFSKIAEHVVTAGECDRTTPVTTTQASGSGSTTKASGTGATTTAKKGVTTTAAATKKGATTAKKGGTANTKGSTKASGSGGNTKASGSGSTTKAPGTGATTAKNATVTATGGSSGPSVNVVFTFKSAADKGAVKTALSSSFKEKYGKSFLRLDVSTTKPSRRRLKPILRRRLAATTFYITVVLAGKASDLSSGITDFVSNGLVASLKKQNLCSDTKPCTVEKPVISATKGSGSGSTTTGSGSGSTTTGSGSGSKTKGSGSGGKTKGSGS